MYISTRLGKKEKKMQKKKVFTVLNRQCQRLGSSENVHYLKHRSGSTQSTGHNTNTLSLLLTITPTRLCFILSKKRERERERERVGVLEREENLKRERAELGCSQLHCPLAQNPRKH